MIYRTLSANQYVVLAAQSGQSFAGQQPCSQQQSNDQPRSQQQGNPQLSDDQCIVNGRVYRLPPHDGPVNVYA